MLKIINIDIDPIKPFTNKHFNNPNIHPSPVSIFANLSNYSYMEVPNEITMNRFGYVITITSPNIIVKSPVLRLPNGIIYKSIELEGGGSRIDKVYPESLPISWLINGEMPYSDDKYRYLPLPFLIAPSNYHINRINICVERGYNCGTDIKLVGNVYEMPNKCFECKIIQTKYNGRKYLTSLNNRYKLDLIPPMIMLYIYTLVPIKSMRFEIDGKIYDIGPYNNVLIKFDIPFRYSENRYLHVELETISEIYDSLYIFGYSYNILRYWGGMISLCLGG